MQHAPAALASHTRPLNIVVVGGLDRAAPGLRELAVAHGHVLEHHVGTSSGPGKRGMDALIGRADIVVIGTGHNNQLGVSFARERARHHGVPSLICRRFGPANLSRLLEALEHRRSLPTLDREAALGIGGAFCINDGGG